jgi:hypothetical protein
MELRRTHHQPRHKTKPRRCATCGDRLTNDESTECGTCSAAWRSAARAPGFLPTVEIDLCGEAGPPAPPAERPGATLDLFREDR